MIISNYIAGWFSKRRLFGYFYVRIYKNSYGVANLMSCHNSALTCCHKLVHLSVTVPGLSPRKSLLYRSNHLMVCHKSYHMLVYQTLLLLICIH